MAIKRFSAPEADQPDRWEAQLRKGALEMAALASLWRGRLYGLEIIRFLEAQSRLRTESLLTSEWVEADAGHPRKYYSLTDAGRERLRLMAAAWMDFSTGLTQLLEPVLEPEEVTQ